jgi:uracil-DNA glycosylase
MLRFSHRVGKRLVDIRFQSGRYFKERPPSFDAFAQTMTPLWPAPHAYRGPPEQNVDIIKEWNCKGKFIYIILDEGRRDAKNATNATEEEDDDFQRSIWITLGMTGRFVNEQAHLQDPSFARWYLELIDPTYQETALATTAQKTVKIHYHDQRNFGTLKFCLSKSELDNKLASLGPDILRDADDDSALTKDRFIDILSQQKPTLSICRFLMNQSKLAGVGNYILSETLYRAKIDPFCTIEELDATQQSKIFEEMIAVAQESYAAQGMTRYKSGAYRTMEGARGKFEFELQCYGRETDPRGRPVLRETNGPHQRTIWYVEEQLFMPREDRVEEIPPSNDSSRKRTRSVSVNDTDKVITAADSPSSTLTTHPSSDITFEDLLDGLTEPSWKEALEPHFSSESFQRLQRFLKDEQASGVTVYPSPESVFHALNMCPLQKTKVVILGQDPYHGPNQGMGMAFSVNKGIPMPPSLRNIFKEAMDDVGINPPQHGSLESWAEQGVLLLNTVLTVRRGQANSHATKGWEDFTDEVVRILNDRDDKIVFLLWGRPAAQKAGKAVDPDKHIVITTSHPSPLGATKTAVPFLSSRCFSRANKALRQIGKDPIDWNVR